MILARRTGKAPSGAINLGPVALRPAPEVYGVTSANTGDLRPCPLGSINV